MLFLFLCNFKSLYGKNVADQKDLLIKREIGIDSEFDTIIHAVLVLASNEKADDAHTNTIMREGSSNGWKRK